LNIVMQIWHYNTVLYKKGVHIILGPCYF
jgi:hypothetical protein